MSYSPFLSYFAERLEGLSTSIFRLEAQNQTSNITPQSIIRFTLPSNALCDIHSFSFNFQCGTNDGTGNTVNRLPNGIEHIISRVDVNIGGVSLASGTNFYNVLVKAKEVVDGYSGDAGLTHPELITTGSINNYVDGVALTNGETPTAVGNKAQFSISNWCGFLGECQPKILSTDLFGDMVITIYLEQASLCLTQSDNITTSALFLANANFASSSVPTYTLNNIYATITCYSLASGVYDNMIANMMSSQGELEVPFKQYFSFRDTNQGSTRFTVASQSLDRLIVAHHENVAPVGTTLAPKLVAGYNNIDTQVLANRLLSLGKVKYIAPYTNFSLPPFTSGTPLQFEYILNGARYPQFRMTESDVLRIMRSSSYNDDYVNKDMGLIQYITNYFVGAVKLTLDAPSARYIQGLDTRSVSLNGYYNIFNMTSAGKVITLFAECTSSLIISSGRQISVVN